MLERKDALYLLLFGRYIYLYREYLDYHELDAHNDGNFDSVRKDIDEVLDKTDVDDKIKDAADTVKKKTKEVLDKTDIDEKIVDTAKKVKKRVTKKKGEDE